MYKLFSNQIPSPENTEKTAMQLPIPCTIRKPSLASMRAQEVNVFGSAFMHHEKRMQEAKDSSREQSFQVKNYHLYKK